MHRPKIVVRCRLSRRTDEPDNEICKTGQTSQEYEWDGEFGKFLIKTAFRVKHCIRNFEKDEDTPVLKEIRDVGELLC